MWDIAVDGATGDWVFGPSRDLLGVTGVQLNEQRIAIRCRVPRGSFAPIPQLGSRLRSLLSLTSERQIRDAPTLIDEALEGMDIEIKDVVVTMNGRQLVCDIMYSPVAPAVGELQAAPFVPEFSTRVTV